jgi:uncharacterized membrane protein YadS
MVLSATAHLLLLGGVAAIGAQVSPREVLSLQPRLVATLSLTTLVVALAALLAATTLVGHAR